MAEPKKERNAFYITHSVELLIWLIISLAVVMLFVAIHINDSISANDYNIFMQDVDGLIVGSPVRMMGIEVGHVTKIKPTNEEVYIKFIITDSEIKLPRGTIATVEFSGMAGSKSLELYLPNQDTYVDENIPILTVEPPKRLHDALGLLNDMLDKLGAIIYTSSSFGEKIRLLNIQTGGGNSFKQFLDYSGDLIDDATRKSENLEQKLNEAANNGDK